MHRLTDRQQEVLAWVKGYIGEWGYAPTFAEVSDGLKLGSTQAATDHIRALEKKGYLRRTPRVARGMILLK